MWIFISNLSQVAVPTHNSRNESGEEKVQEEKEEKQQEEKKSSKKRREEKRREEKRREEKRREEQQQEETREGEREGSDENNKAGKPFCVVSKFVPINFGFYTKSGGG